MKSYTFFWNGPFSQWCPSKFILNEITFNCAEQYMMYRKATLFGDNESAVGILKEPSPSDQKRMGRLVKGFQEETWLKHRETIVYRGNHAKFTQNRDLAENLMETAGTTIVEASPYDCIWGIGLAANDPRSFDERNWRGQNLLGKILTQLRRDLEIQRNG